MLSIESQLVLDNQAVIPRFPVWNAQYSGLLFELLLFISNGNFRVLNRIFPEIERLQKLNCLTLITPDLVETARQGLLLGAA